MEIGKGSEGCHRNEEIRVFNQDQSAYLVSLESAKIVKREHFKRFAIKLRMRRINNIWKNRRKDDEDFQSIYLLPWKEVAFGLAGSSCWN